MTLRQSLVSAPRRWYRSPPPVSTEFAKLLAAHAATPARPLNLDTLLSFGRPLTPTSLLESVSYALSEIPRRLATQVRTLEGLPFIVGTNPYIAKTLSAYRNSFELLATYSRPENLDENEVFSSRLEALVRNHANDIEVLARG
jgi:26S proteasome regulatory subunit T1